MGPPAVAAVDSSVRLLVTLGALRGAGEEEAPEELTPLVPTRSLTLLLDFVLTYLPASCCACCRYLPVHSFHY